MPELKNVVLPELSRPKTLDESYAIVQRLTGNYWQQFSMPRSSSGSTGGRVGGQHFLALRAKGPRWKVTQPLIWLCGQGVLTAPELINALGRRTVMHSTGYEEQISTPNRAEPTPSILAKTEAYGFATWPLEDFVKITGIRAYDKDLPKVASMPYVYVIEDRQADVKVGISNDPQRRFRDLERDEKTTLQRWFCLKKPTRYALAIEQAVLNHFGKGRNTRKKSEEWLWQVTFEDAKAAVERELATYQ